MALRSRQKGLELYVEISPEVPKWIKGDPNRLRQVLLNIADNALKFTKKGMISLSVELESNHPEGKVIRFNVKDTGMGIPIDKSANIFKAFSQADSSVTRKYGGTGLGLAICKQLVELMGGEIHFNTQENHGSEFWFTLLAGECSESANASLSVASDQDRNEKFIKQYKNKVSILLVEDNMVAQKVFQNY